MEDSRDTVAGFEIFVNILNVGKRRPQVERVPFMLRFCPSTLRQLISLAVEVCVADYNARIEQPESQPPPISSEVLAEKEKIGKIAFGLNYNGRLADIVKAKESALQAYADGMVRIILPQGEAGGLDDPVALKKGDSVTFVKLAMLAGRMW